jgi:hypothetical protein
VSPVDTYNASSGQWVRLGVANVNPPPPPVESTVFGAAITPYPGTGRNHAQEVAQHEADCGIINCLRTYTAATTPLPFDWLDMPSFSGSTDPTVGDWENRWSWHSIKPDPQATASGSLFDDIVTSIISIPVTGKKRLITSWHEPDAGTKVPGIMSHAEWKQQAYQFGLAVRAANHPDVLYGPVFSSTFTLAKATDLMNATADDLRSVCDFVGFDPYHEASKTGQYGAPYDDISYYFDGVVDWRDTYFAGIPLAIGETGFIADPLDVNRKAAWLVNLEQWCADNDVLVCCYFDANVNTFWYLRIYNDGGAAPYPVDAPAIAAWSGIYSRHPLT